MNDTSDLVPATGDEIEPSDAGSVTSPANIRIKIDRLEELTEDLDAMMVDVTPLKEQIDLLRADILADITDLGIGRMDGASATVTVVKTKRFKILDRKLLEQELFRIGELGRCLRIVPELDESEVREVVTRELSAGSDTITSAVFQQTATLRLTKHDAKPRSRFKKPVDVVLDELKPSENDDLPF